VFIADQFVQQDACTEDDNDRYRARSPAHANSGDCGKTECRREPYRAHESWKNWERNSAPMIET
jgi:hypothetical protein